jgi:hypothetical protein
MKSTDLPRAVADRQRRTCIEILRKNGLVHCIPLDINGLELVQMNEQTFNDTYKPLKDYPVEKAAKLYAAYSADIGGSPEVMKALASIIPLSTQEIQMATAKKASAAKAAKEETKPVKKAAEKPAKTVAAAKEPVAKAEKPAKAAAKTVAKKATGEKTHSAANMFKDLIMEGKLTDDQIFAKVQKEFSLDDSKRSYVRWYRNDLTKKGMNPPEAK